MQVQRWIPEVSGQNGPSDDDQNARGGDFLKNNVARRIQKFT